MEDAVETELEVEDLESDVVDVRPLFGVESGISVLIILYYL